MEYFIIGVVSLLGAALTLFSGFGLGTLLLPAFGLFFPIEIAVVLTALVHFMNNIFKWLLLGQKANKKVVLKFGIPAILFAFLGAYLLSILSQSTPVFQYKIGQHHFVITTVKICIGSLLILFALFDSVPKFKNLSFPEKYLPLGGALSGFFGGLSGHQGALRSAFLIRLGLSKESFIATGVVIACIIDISRLSLYIPKIIREELDLNYSLILTATTCAFVGVYFGNKLLQKTTITFVQTLVGIALLLYGIALIAGII